MRWQHLVNTPLEYPERSCDSISPTVLLLVRCSLSLAHSQTRNVSRDVFPNRARYRINTSRKPLQLSVAVLI